MFQWADYLALAKTLAEQRDESAVRSAVSRAYYAAYNVAFRKLPASVKEELQRNQDSSHARVWNSYKFAPDPLAKRIGDTGASLKGMRQTADYRAATPQSKKDAVVAITLATNILMQLERVTLDG